MSFPPNFAWGAATAAYQVEGAAFEDGRKSSVWDMFTRKEGAVFNGHTGDVACDHYHRFPEDVAIMKQIGLKAYRLSISWPRILPDGTGTPNPAGLGFYDRLIDELLSAGITPYVTLFHWDFPYELYRQGGWLNPSSPDWFAEYTHLVVDRLSDRVQNWFTLNEPACFVWLGHADGVHAPGDRLATPQLLQIMHNALLAHGRSVQAIRATARTPARVGAALVGHVAMPAADNPVDIEAARQVMFTPARKDLWNIAWWADPIFKGAYPEAGLRLFASQMPAISPSDMELISQPLDFFGVNIYQGVYYRRSASGEPQAVPFPPGSPTSAYHWQITPDALYWGPRFLWERYRQPLIIAENGMANVDWIALDGAVHDPQRIDFTRRYLLELRRAISDGVPVLGYFHWSLLDNFEWAEGYSQRFGMVYVDFQTQQRIPKDSAHWYREVIAANGECL